MIARTQQRSTYAQTFSKWDPVWLAKTTSTTKVAPNNRNYSQGSNNRRHQIQLIRKSAASLPWCSERRRYSRSFHKVGLLLWGAPSPCFEGRPPTHSFKSIRRRHSPLWWTLTSGRVRPIWRSKPMTIVLLENLNVTLTTIASVIFQHSCIFMIAHIIQEVQQMQRINKLHYFPRTLKCRIFLNSQRIAPSCVKVGSRRRLLISF